MNKIDLLQSILKIKKLIGNTPLIELDNLGHKIFAKLEYNNFSGSVKDRAVNNILYNGILDGHINSETKIVESSSGNFGMSAALHCNMLNLDFTVVVDPQISKTNLKMLKLFAKKVIMVEEPDGTGGYLLSRIKKVKEIVSQAPNTFWTNQYANENNYKGYSGLSKEIKDNFSQLDYLFVGVSSCGTITGLGKYLKEKFPNLTVVAIDINGSLIFSDKKCSRHITGLGAGKKASFLKEGVVDDVVMLSHKEIISGCNHLLSRHSIFAGGSSGACYYGALKYLKNAGSKAKNAVSVIICPDRGASYIDNVYNSKWVEKVTREELEYETVS